MRGCDHNVVIPRCVAIGLGSVAIGLGSAEPRGKINQVLQPEAHCNGTLTLSCVDAKTTNFMRLGIIEYIVRYPN
jgi:hypothetical protein